MKAIETEAATGLRDMGDGSPVDRVLLVGDVQRRPTRRGSDYLRLVVSDRTGRLPGVMWEPPTRIETGPTLRVVGRIADHPRYGRQVVVSELSRPDADEVDLASLVVGPSQNTAALELRLDGAVESIEDDSLRELLRRMLGAGGSLRDRFVRATAAKYNHHAYRGGLLEHSLQIVDCVTRAAEVYGADRDLCVAGALLHDIGKLDAYDEDPMASDLTDRGRLEGEIPMGYFAIRREIEEMPGFPDFQARALLHIVLSHHGRLEHGSPVAPCSREAALVHAMDKLSGTMGAFDRLERETEAGADWSHYDHVLEAAAWMSGRAPAEVSG
jgi:3'-5' exoribonuclease